ncbi:MAG: bifunctional chorismate mutase/prephenate dehydratase [Ruminococcaceae bacterium]|nr:bifunctional chorismate mutase/prephenate dehydratase [Oscillospiraceae bacterium]
MDLEALREKLNGVDDEILRLFLERMETVGKIADYKKEHNLPVLSAKRERSILERVCEKSGEELEDYTRILYTTLFDLSRSYQTRKLNPNGGVLSSKIQSALENTPQLFPKRGIVACQGVEGAYSQHACDKLFPSANIIYFKNFEGVFSAVERGLCQYGMLPIENSIHGTVNEVYDLMRHFRFYIVRSVKLKIDHALLTAPGVRMTDIREIFSHEQAVGQCSEFLKKYPQIKVTICENTAMAAQKVAESGRKDCASISSRDCAALYGLQVAEDGIQNSDSNYTRFICIAKEMAIYPGANRISLMLSVPHTPGALYTMISKFSALGLNLTKLESRPIPGRDFEFLFYFDMEASVYSPAVLSLLDELAGGPEQFVFLGSYSEG